MSEAPTEKIWSKLKEKYAQFLANNVAPITQLEQWLKVVSYLVAGRLSKEHSAVIAELMYSAANVLRIFHDYILRDHFKLDQSLGEQPGRIETFLTVLENLEVFVEIAAGHYSDPAVRWIAIFTIQLIKAAGRCVLLFRKNQLQRFPLINRLDRKPLIDPKLRENATPDAATANYFTTSTGRRVKTFNTPTGSAETFRSSRVDPQTSHALSRDQMHAECLRIFQPIIHLVSMYITGQKSWIPWIISAATDGMSLRSLRSPRYHYTKPEQDELSRRNIMLLMYLFRSPFFDHFTKLKILRVLTIISNIPGASYITEPLKQYIPEWQEMYFYTWSS